MKPFKKAGLFGLLLIPFTIALMSIGPPQAKAPEGYISSIVALEFASNNKERAEVLGDLSHEEVKSLDLIDYIDFPFMLVYGTFLFLILSKIESITKLQFFRFFKWTPPLIVFCDFMENLQLFKLTRDHLNGLASS